MKNKWSERTTKVVWLVTFLISVIVFFVLVEILEFPFLGSMIAFGGVCCIEFFMFLLWGNKINKKAVLDFTETLQKILWFFIFLLAIMGIIEIVFKWPYLFESNQSDAFFCPKLRMTYACLGFSAILTLRECWIEEAERDNE